MDAEAMKERTKKFALRVIKLVEALPKTRVAGVIGNQLLRAGTSVGANYGSACRGRSKPEFISKVSIAVEEADEAYYRMELLPEAKIFPFERLADLMQEANELVAILTASIITARKNAQRAPGKS
jgi:four helix bundle protein